MNDDEKLSVLDRRAAAATAALDEAVQQVPVPEPDLGEPRRSVRRFLPLAVAAGLAIIALVGAALVFDDDEQSTIAEQPGSITRLALPDPEALGYRIIGAFDGDKPDDRLPRDLVIPLTVQSPAGAAGPWAETVVSYSLSAEMTTLDGESVDVGGPEATLSSENGPLTVGWVDGPRVYYLQSVGMSAGELVALARAAVADRVADGEALPGHEIVYAGPHTDVFPILSSATAAAASGMDGIVYESDDGGFVVATGEGSANRWRASRALAFRTDRATVRGRDALIADFGNGLTEISWLEADGTLVRVNPMGRQVPIEDLAKLEPISDTDFTALVRRFSQEQSVGYPTTTLDEGEQIAGVATEERGIVSRATLLWRAGAEFGFELEVASAGPEGSSAASQPLPNRNSNVVAREDVQGDYGELIGGVIGPDVERLEIVDAMTGEPINASGPSTATIEGSSHVVFLATVDDKYGDRDLVVVGTTAAGVEVRLSAPAQR